MPTFRKAQPQQARLKVCMYGPQGSGKTFTTLLLAEGLAQREGKRIAYVDTERGTDFYAMNIDDRQIHPQAFDFDALYTRSLADTLEAIQSLDPAEHGVIVIDSISHLWDAAIEAYNGKMVGQHQDKIPIQAWGQIKRPYKQLIRHLLDAPMHVFICGRQKNLFETEDGEFRKTGVALRAESETEYEPHICLRMERAGPNDPDATIFAVCEKDRSGVLSAKHLPNPSFETVRPILRYLGGEQAASEDPDATAERDSELLDQEERAQKKREASEALFAELSAKIQRTRNLSDLATVAGEVKKAKRKLVPEHMEALRLSYTSRQKELSQKEAPTEV